jgi:hypothetical protein
MAKWTLPILCLVGIVLLLLPEFLAPAQRENSPRFPGPPPMDWRTASMDKNGDNQITLAEAQSERPEITAEEFKLRDSNGDGVWSSTDRRWSVRTMAGRRSYEEVDKNSDGKITLDEYTAACQEEFKNLDADTDGGIILEEWPSRFGGPGFGGMRPWAPPPEGFVGGPPPGIPMGEPGRPGPSGFMPDQNAPSTPASEPEGAGLQQ